MTPVDDHRPVPAAWKYSGTFWREAGPSIRTLVGDGGQVLILSGGYGLLDAREPIGDYNSVFRRSDWPPSLVERCLTEYCYEKHVTQVVAFLAATTQYADVVRRSGWSNVGVDAYIVSIDMAGRRGAQQLVPRGLGQALTAYVGGDLTAGWRSSFGNSTIVRKCD